jgi:glutamate synthase (NADPH/NADH) small chain
VRPTGFLEIARRDPDERDVADRVRDFAAIERRLPLLVVREQARRCMGCGVPFCHAGCPLGNAIPDFQDAVERGSWAEAFALLDRTNNFPEVTGRICPAPCEAACVLGIGADPVTIESIEREIATRAFDEGWVVPRPPEHETGRRVTVVGSGPAGLAAAQQLRRAGHRVTVIERGEKPGGLLRYGIPDFKLDKTWLDRRLLQIEAEGVVFRCGTTLGDDVTLASLRTTEDAVVIATGATVPRDLEVPGRALDGVHFAMDFLVPQNRVTSGALDTTPIDARGRRVLVLGGGDTGSDCVGTALRQGAASVTSIELLPRPPETRAASTPWPLWPVMFRVSSSHEEGGVREFALRTTHFVGEAGRVTGIACTGVERRGNGLVDVAGSDRVLEADLVLLALGFTGPERAALAGAALHDDFTTSMPGVFACGDARRGQSLVVWAIWEGRRVAETADAFLAARPIAHALHGPQIPFNASRA